ncbi:MAG: hypothetical protein L0Z50_42830 [Verrucomicrobiales bacterium]|nr:hypothetical protein [Verrucomicrobiales bacterium]
MNATDCLAQKPSNQLWGIYYTDREYAREKGDPLRTVVEAPTQSAAEQAAARLGFSDAWAHPVTAEEAKRAQWLPQNHPKRRRQIVPNQPRGLRI